MREEAIFLANDGEEKSALINRVSSTIYIALLLLPFFFFFFLRPLFIGLLLRSTFENSLDHQPKFDGNLLRSVVQFIYLFFWIDPQRIGHAWNTIVRNETRVPIIRNNNQKGEAGEEEGTRDNPRTTEGETILPALQTNSFRNLHGRSVTTGYVI